METSFLFLSLGVGFILGWAIFYLIQRYRIGNIETLGKEIIRQAEKEGEGLKHSQVLQLKEQQLAQNKEFEQFKEQERKKIHLEETRIKQREDRLENRMHLIEKTLSDIDKKDQILSIRSKELDEEKKSLEKGQTLLRQDLEKISGLSSTSAKEMLLSKIQSEVMLETGRFIQRGKEEAEAASEAEAKKIITTAINRLASATVSEVTICTVSLPSDEMKGRIIGREGRNIRALEKACGVNFLMDDTPQAVVISSFDPVRRQIAKLTLTDLIQDGRIHPTKIEEAFEKATLQVEKQIKQHGEDAALRIGAIQMHPELHKLLGKLKFRLSLGQNVLDHSLEVAHLMGMMAGELDLDVSLAKRIGLLHDIGKAVTHEMPGTHALIGQDLALKYGESSEVANGIGCHHNEISATTLEGSLCGSADAISASRPGVRIEAVEEYMQRLKKLEEIAYEFPGVERAYALQAGREVRVMVLPDALDDTGLMHLARDLTKRIEKELKYSGKIKVTALREKRVIDYAM